MKKTITSLMILVLTAGVLFSAPKPKILPQLVTPDVLKYTPVLVPDSCVTTGLSVVANKTYVYLSVMNIGDTSTIQSSTYTLDSKPSGSNATISTIPSLGWVKFRTDVVGQYIVRTSITTSTGTKDTTIKITSANYVGVGNYENVPATYPNCMSCHATWSNFQTIFNKWKVSGHATRFKRDIDSGGTAGFSTSCMKCHTTGYDHNQYADNHGFDDVARQVGWSWTTWGPPKKGNWDSLVNKYPTLSQFATIGCESCHGAGSQHASTGDTTAIEIPYKPNVCGKCHESYWRHTVYTQWRASLHSNPVMEGRTVADSLRNNLNDCNRCHDGRDFLGYYSYNRKDPIALNKGDQTPIGCQTCHDPHGGSGEHQLRVPATGSDTLANGVSYTAAGNGKICMSCHSARKNAATFITVRGSFSSTWGPHENPQGDVLWGSNLATFGFPWISGSHKNNPDACVSCHMAATTDTGTVTYNKVGLHSMNMTYGTYENVKGCLNCHPGVTSFDDFVAPQDFDGNGLIESWQKEVKGCISKLGHALPHTGYDTVNWIPIARDSNNINLRKAYWNYLMITKDGSYGIHNPFLAVQVLLTSINYAVGISQNGTEIPKAFELSQNYPNPFNPSTKIDFSLPRAENISIKIYDMTGREIKSLVDMRMQPGKYSTEWLGTDGNGRQVSSGVYFYRLVAGGNVITKKMILIK
ncbi:MAG: T9SS type A sorting domain-containing protein [Bacteroidetes bacterium]|nr:T9SS type A sorting domain-containing protein [Bacteroidota bacterium]